MRGYDDDAIPSYQLLIETTSPDAYEPGDNTTNNATPIVVGQRTTHTLSPTGDVDWFTFDLSNSANVLVMTDSINPLLDPDRADTSIVLYKDEGGLTAISTNDDGNHVYFSAIFRVGLDSGKYYLEVKGSDLTSACPDYLVALDVFERSSSIAGVRAATNGMSLAWQGDASFSYQIQYTNNLFTTQSWAVATNVEGRMGANSWVDDGSVTTPTFELSTQRFYRIVIP